MIHNNVLTLSSTDIAEAEAEVEGTGGSSESTSAAEAGLCRPEGPASGESLLLPCDLNLCKEVNIQLLI